MKKLLVVLLLSIGCVTVYASPQASEILIMGKDTIFIYQFPFVGIGRNTEKLLQESISNQGGGVISTGLLRGFRGVWEIIDDKLYFVDIKYVDNPKKVLHDTFGNKYIDGKVFADWFSSALIIPKGEVLRWDGVFARTYHKEEHLVFRHGKLIRRKSVTNYIPVAEAVPRNQSPFYNYPTRPLLDAILNAIKYLNWDELSENLCDDEYIVTIGPDGFISKVEFVDPKYSCRKCVRVLRRNLKKIRFDIIRWNGKPYSERIQFYLDYDKKSQTLEYLYY